MASRLRMAGAIGLVLVGLGTVAVAATIAGPEAGPGKPAVPAAGGKAVVKTLPAGNDPSLKLEVQHAIDRGLTWLEARQDPKGFWSTADHPALTALVLTAFMADPSGRAKINPPAGVASGYQYLTSCVQPDGGIYRAGLANYNTAVAVTALVAAYNESYQPVLRRARNFLVGLQQDLGEPGTADDPYDGGIGYGDRYRHSDLSNTVFALEAIHYTKFLAGDQSPGGEAYKELNWGAAVKFIERCQNLPGVNDQAWASGDPKNRGGFVYFPGDSKAGEEQLPNGKTALRSYGSISYAGLLSYIYADLDRDDPRVQAVIDWLQKNFTLDENPGMEQQGLYYYYHTMAKALSVYGADRLTLADGKQLDWRRKLALKLLNLQRADGSWVNANGRFWEKDPVLVTAYALISLEVVSRGL